MDIYGWDMVCAVSCNELNKKLKTASHEAFGQFTWFDNEGNTISGEFDGWKIVPGGDAQRINIITSISTGRLGATVLGQHVDVSVNGLCPCLQVELAFVNAGVGDNNTNLKFNLARVSKSAPVTAGDGSVVVLNPDINRLFPASESIIPDMYCEMMAEMLVAREDKLAFIFAEIMDIPADNDVSWMKLHLLQYVYNEKIKGELGCMAVLGILADNPSPPAPDSLQLIFDSSLVREGGSVGFMLSRRTFMKHIVLPGLPDVFEGSDISQFLLDDNNVIKNNGSISLKRINGYTPYFNSLNVEVIDNLVVLNNASGRCDVVSYSSYVLFELSTIYTPRFTEAGGRYTLSLEGVNRSVFNCETHDTVAQAFWIFGGWVVDALVKGIKAQLDSRLFEFGHHMNLDLFPVTFSTNARYSDCGLADNFYLQG
ncbi:TULIP family P47-like protein [Serratia marcescens]|uniref:TULIP family P47-like protein n=1 Tax=Serratia marcescens TaxID=615 RepID=UPI0022386B17|nr:TULIP family P47-like protein [Serratia marcescens]MCW6015992.1 TULIP family P47-like protein [Serratia marcescens]MCW6023244.1 TULIP family P47-like protein [Serratia marcescens]